MFFPKSRNGLRGYLLRGIALSIVVVAAAFAFCVWQVWHYGQRTLPAGYSADAAVVLGAAAWDKRPSPVFRERINHAIALYQSGRVKRLVFTGGTPKPGYMTEAEVGRRYAVKQGVPAKHILFENTSRTTYQNLKNIRPLLRTHNIGSIIIVTDPYHTARAAAIAAEFGYNAQTSGTPTSRYQEKSSKNSFFWQESYNLFAYYFERLTSKVLPVF